MKRKHYYQVGVVVGDSEIRLSPNVWDTVEDARMEADQQTGSNIRTFVRWWDIELGKSPPFPTKEEIERATAEALARRSQQ